MLSKFVFNRPGGSECLCTDCVPAVYRYLNAQVWVPCCAMQAVSHAFRVPGVIYGSIYKGNNGTLKRRLCKAPRLRSSSVNWVQLPKHRHYVSTDLQMEKELCVVFHISKARKGRGRGTHPAHPQELPSQLTFSYNTTGLPTCWWVFKLITHLSCTQLDLSISACYKSLSWRCLSKDLKRNVR